MFPCIISMAWPPASCQDPGKTYNYCFLCGHYSGLASHIGAQLPQTDQRPFLALIVIDMTCGFVLVPRMCHSLCKIAGFVCVSSATAQMTNWECFIAFGHTHLCHTECNVSQAECRKNRVQLDVFTPVYQIYSPAKAGSNLRPETCKNSIVLVCLAAFQSEYHTFCLPEKQCKLGHSFSRSVEPKVL